MSEGANPCNRGGGAALAIGSQRPNRSDRPAAPWQLIGETRLFSTSPHYQRIVAQPAAGPAPNTHSADNWELISTLAAEHLWI